MKIKFHPDDSTLLAYASGTLDEAFAVIVSCHLQVCTTCREAVKTAELIGGATLDQTEEVALSQGSFGRMLEKISIEPQSEGSETMKQEHIAACANDDRPEWSQMPRALQHYLKTDINNVAWKRLAPGVWHHPIRISPNAKSSLRLFRIAHGKEMPEHGHGGHELTLILQGSYQDKFGVFAEGDIADLDDDVEHQPKVTSKEDCICLAATEAPTKFKGLIERLLQPIIGI